MAATPTHAQQGRLAGPYKYFNLSSVLDTGGSSSALVHLVAGSSSGGPNSSTQSGFVNGWLHGITVNTAGTGSPITIWDGGLWGSSGQGSSTNHIAALDITKQGTFPYDIGFSNWLTVAVASSNTTADITVTYETFNG